MSLQKSANPDEFILPDLGEGVHEAELIKWRVKVGDHVAEHDILAEMETDKALVEVPSPREGVIASLNGKEGEILKVGNILVTYQSAGGGGGAPSAKTQDAHGAEAKKEWGIEAPKSSHGAAQRNGAHDDDIEIAERTEDAGTVVGKMGGELAGMSAAPGKALATPAVRRLARDLGVDIDSISGTGIGGRVTEKDVRSASSGSPSPEGRGLGKGSSGHGAQAAPARASRPVEAPVSRPSAPAPSRPALGREEVASKFAPQPSAPARQPVSFAQQEGDLRIPFRGVRRTIANRLRQSINQAVHFTVMDEADVTALETLRKKLAAASGEKVSFLPFVASAVARVLNQSQFRALNATVEEDAANPSADAFIIQHRSVHLGIATDTETGLMVPVIRDADRLGVLEVSRAIAMTAEMARNRSIPREQLMGSTFTISNVGSHAGRFATPVINYPEVGILAVGRAKDGVVVNRGMIGVGKLLPLSLACDHRVVDGATAALALAEIVKLLQDAEQLLGPARG
ncbi:MAG: 2-oxo acid dehydrogenase subunit E2 [Phycisphaeraceae bacterium]|nr:2-oxo acid dehydrogenase subunit E2 [Phycisphaeraceae bacterium]